MQQNPEWHLAYLRTMKKSGHIVECYPGLSKICREYVVKKGMVKVWEYDLDGCAQAVNYE
jgi:hypothetical protein